jgi:hypothetical protein
MTPNLLIMYCVLCTSIIAVSTNYVMSKFAHPTIRLAAGTSAKGVVGIDSGNRWCVRVPVVASIAVEVSWCQLTPCRVQGHGYPNRRSSQMAV